MVSGIKLLICGLERSGKTTLTSNIKNSFVISCDAKQYPYKVPHWNMNLDKYEGFDSFRGLLQEKMEAYKEKFGAYPKTIVFDTMTQLYTMIKKLAYKTRKGYDVWTFIDQETLDYNSYVENNLVSQGFNVVIVAHTQLDKDTLKYFIPADASFKKTGSWLSVVDNSSYVDYRNDNFEIIHKDLNYPCRTIIPDLLPESEPVKGYDINKHIEMLTNHILDNQEYEF